MNRTIDCIVAGHTCMDLLPRFTESAQAVSDIFQPGKLVQVGPMEQATGGVVPNTSAALCRLGTTVIPMGKVGDDLLGHSILDKMTQLDLPTQSMHIDPACATSYTIVINILGIDRIPLHHPGVNDVFSAADIDFDVLKRARHFHFGYPPLMRSLYLDEGRQLSAIFSKAKSLGLSTSMDMARPDPDTEAGRVNWLHFLQQVLPSVDLFTPSIDELLYMIDRPLFDRFSRSSAPLGGLQERDLSKLGQQLLAMGTQEVLIKLGESGAYYMSKDEAYYSPCYQVELRGAIGSGDCTVAGFLAARLRGLSAAASLNVAVATGACNVEALDATSGIPTWDDLQARLKKAWKQHPPLF